MERVIALGIVIGILYYALKKKEKEVKTLAVKLTEKSGDKNLWEELIKVANDIDYALKIKDVPSPEQIKEAIKNNTLDELDKIVINTMKTIQPEFGKRVEAFLNDLKKEIKKDKDLKDYSAHIHQYLRSSSVQVKKVRDGYSKTFGSYHSVGLAVDIVPYNETYKRFEWTTTKADKIFSLYKNLAKKHKIIWGGEWKSFVDKPHLQAPMDILNEEAKLKVKNKIIYISSTLETKAKELGLIA